MLSTTKYYLFLLLLTSNIFAENIFSKTDFSNNNSKENNFYANATILFLVGSIKGYQDSGDIENTEDVQVYPFPVVSADLYYKMGAFTLVDKLNLSDGLGIGLNYDINERSQLQFYYVPKQTGIQTFAIDPLDPNKTNEGTDYHIESLELGLTYILNTPISIFYTYRREEVLNDQNGFSLGLTPSQTQSLQRSFESHAFDLKYEAEIFKESGFETTLHYTDTDAKGEANSYDMFGLSIATLSSYHKIFYGLEAHYKHSNYKQDNPLRNIKELRKNYNVNLYLGYQYSSALSFYFSYTLNNIDSNTDTYDQRIRFIATGLSYDF